MINSEIFGATTPGPWGGRAGVAGLRLTVTVIAVDWQHMLLAVDQKGPKDGAGEALFFFSPNLTASALMEGRSFLLEVALFIVWTTVGWSEGADIGGVTNTCWQVSPSHLLPLTARGELTTRSANWARGFVEVLSGMNFHINARSQAWWMHCLPNFQEMLFNTERFILILLIWNVSSPA